jgi:DNA-formamidopyrimidine glycosylase
MPEGPEVRTVATKLHTYLFQQTISQLWVNPEAGIKFHGNLYNILHAQVLMVTTRGKKLIMHFTNGYSLIAGLGMTGRFLFQGSKHSQMAFGVGNLMTPTTTVGSANNIPNSLMWIFFEDSRRFGHIDVLPTAELEIWLSDIGPDVLMAALTTEISFVDWYARFPTTSVRKIFEVMKDQKYVSGIGNYLASEILYYSAIHPARLTSSLTLQEWETLRSISHAVIRLSFSHGGFTIESFISPDGVPGLYPAAVYGLPFTEQGYPISKMKIGQQNAYFVSAIQH